MNTLFNINTTPEAGQFLVTINKDSHIFEGHFPGNPVVPGVMSIYLIRKCAGIMLNRSFEKFCAIKEVRYLNPMKSETSPIIVLISASDSDSEQIVITAEITDKDGVQLVKLKGTLC
ncbi:MAG: hypothetical protein HUJ96_01945 [Marinilabiliaceae bacterium]|nr:hypothetical protein [Marinilabiliaceae bacterium]